MLWLGIHLPNLALEVFSRGAIANEPLVVIQSQGPRPRLFACNTLAETRGLRPGMGVDAARSLVPNVRIRARDEHTETLALTQLAAWAGQYTSMVCPVPPGDLVLEVGASLRLFGGLDRLWHAVQRGVNTLGYRTNLAASPTPLGATWLARTGSGARITTLAELAPVLAALPVRGLGLAPDVLGSLERMGVRTLGECLRLPRAGLAHRFGPELVDTFDRASGKRPDPRDGFKAPAEFHSRLLLPAQVTHAEALLFAARRLVLELSGVLLAHGGGVQTLILWLHHDRPPPTRIPLGLAAPSRDPEHLLGLLKLRLERVDLGQPVEEIALEAGAIIPLAPENLSLLARVGESAHDTDLLERLVARLGAGAVRGVCLVAEHRPERAWRYCRPGESGAPGVFGARPLWLLQSPIRLRTVNALPYWHGPLTLVPGRERIESGWWDGQDAARDYFKAATCDGEQLWVFKELHGNGQWFLHGVFE